MPVPQEAQSLSVKRAQVEFHNFASMGEPERAIAAYADENRARGAVLRNHAGFIGGISPFLEIGANAGHTSYMLANDFGAEGFALDISSDALRHGIALMDEWGYSRAPVRVAGDAVNLPFRDGSLRLVTGFQFLSQFMDMERVFVEVKRVLAPGGVFVFGDEPLLRLLSLRLYRAPYYRLMKPWERKLYDWGLLGYLVRDVIGADQEERFGIRQNHTMYLKDWDRLIRKHFTAHEYDVFVPERGWGERVVKNAAIRLDPHGSEWRAARLLGGTLAAMCRKAGEAPSSYPPIERFEEMLRCPDCRSDLRRDASGTLLCSSCSYRAANEGGVYNLLPSKDREDLYPGDREDIIDVSIPGHEARLLDGWYPVEGIYGAKWRWMGPDASAVLKRIAPGRQRLRIRGHAHALSFAQGQPVKLRVTANGHPIGETQLTRPDIFVFEADLPEADEYRIDIHATPPFQAPPDDRVFTVSVSMIRLIPIE